MTDGIESLVPIGRLNREEIQSIWEQVRVNQKRLESCPRPHDFSIEISNGSKLARRWECSVCHGQLDALNAHWYKRGLEDGRRTQSE